MTRITVFENKGYFKAFFELTLKNREFYLGQIRVVPQHGYVVDMLEVVSQIIASIRNQYPLYNIIVPFEYHSAVPVPPDTSLDATYIKI